LLLSCDYLHCLDYGCQKPRDNQMLVTKIFEDKASAVLFASLVLRFTFVDVNQMIIIEVIITRMVIIRLRMRQEI